MLLRLPRRALTALARPARLSASATRDFGRRKTFDKHQTADEEEEEEVRPPKPPYASKVFLQFDQRNRVLLYQLKKFFPLYVLYGACAALIGASWSVYRYFKRNAYIKGALCLAVVVGLSAVLVPCVSFLRSTVHSIWLAKGGKHLVYTTLCSFKHREVAIAETGPSIEMAMMQMAMEDTTNLILETESSFKVVFFGSKYQYFVLDEELLRAVLKGHEVEYDSTEGGVITLN